MGSIITVKDTTAGVPVPNPSDSAKWYSRLLGNIPRIDPAPGIIEFQMTPSAWLQLYQGDTGCQKHVLRLGVADIETTSKHLKEIDVNVGQINRIEHLIAWCNFTDPYGNKLGLYEYLESSEARYKTTK